MRSPRALAPLLALTLAAPAFADDAKPAPKDASKAPSKAPSKEGAKPAPDVDDLFGDALSGGSSMKDLESATQGIERKREGDLKVKTEIAPPDGRVGVLGAFAAARIEVSPKEGCIPAEPERRKVTFIELGEVPDSSPAFSTCVQLSSKASRAMRLSASIVDARNRRVARAHGVVDFTGQERLDYVLDFPPVPFRMAGPHQLVVELEGKEAARVPLFDVKVKK